MQVLLLITSMFIPCSAWVSSSLSTATLKRNHAYNRQGWVVGLDGASLQKQQQQQQLPSPMTTSRLHLLNPLVAGSIAGAIGVGIAFPLDTIKTQQQAATATAVVQVMDHSDIDFNADGSIIFKKSTRPQQARPSLYQSMRLIVERQGLSGLFAGVGTSMMGQAIIKSVAFGVNSAVLAYLTRSNVGAGGGADDAGAGATMLMLGTMDPNHALLVAAATAGFVTAFLATPIDRIKVLRQCSSTTGSNISRQGEKGEERQLSSDMDCLKGVLENEGLQGLLFRGLGPTFFREVPAYTIYFGTYGWLHSTFGDNAVPGATLLYGALAGGLCVLPSYPADVIKTLVQNSNGSDGEADLWKIVQDMYETQGWAGFWDGLYPRMLRASLNHAVTFATYNALL